MNILNGLNEEQKNAVKITEGPLLIIAGAGSGKTKCLTHRIAYLILEKKVSPQEILAITFTNKAASEMKNRIAELFGYQQKEGKPGFLLPWMGTFHSICVKILRREAKQLGYSSSFVIYDEDDSIAVIKKVMKDMELDIKQYAPQAVKSFISGAKNELMNPDQYARYAQGHFQELVVKVYRQYQVALKEAHAFDFDDLIMETVTLFEKNASVLEKYQQFFKYILIDEYQDTNQAQYVLTKQLAAKKRNICAVGDDYQAIYGWRGANFRNLLNFEKDYPEAKVIKLERNYRSTKNILAAAQNVIEQNRHRTDKKLWTENNQGAPITLFQAKNGAEEAQFVVEEMISLKRAHLNWHNFVILYRTNAQSRAFEEMLLQFGMPYRLIGALRFYERKEIKDLLAYLRFINNQNDNVSLERIINVPPRGIGKKTQQAISGLGLSALVASDNPKIAKFMTMIEQLRDEKDQLTVEKLIERILSVCGYKDYIMDGTPEGEVRWENIEELMNYASQATSLDDFLAEVALVADVDNYDRDADAATLMTLHCAKGLEFPVVFMVGMEEGLFPHSRSLMDMEELEEERRLCYVGMTRAKERLYLTYALTRISYGGLQANIPSRFIDEIPKEFMEIIE